MNKNITELQRQLKGIDSYLYMLKTPDRQDTCAIASAAHSHIKLVLCWQQSAGSKNYHESTEEVFNPFLMQAICNKAITLLNDARSLCEAELNKARIARKDELEKELEEIKKLEQAP